MTDGWDERTEAIPGTKGDKSFELDFDFGVHADVKPVDATESLVRPSIVVFEPTTLGLSPALQAFGYSVRTGSTGVDVMSLVAAQPPAVVVCAPAPDPERRRLLAAALRLRFPAIPVLYVSTHAAQEEAVLGAIREGARAVIPWPLPSAAELASVLGPYVKLSADRAAKDALDDDSDAIVTPRRPLTRNGVGEPDVEEPITAPTVPAYSSDELHEAGTAIAPPQGSPVLVDTGLFEPVPVDTGVHEPSLASASAEEILDDDIGPTEMTEVVSPPQPPPAHLRSQPRAPTLPAEAMKPLPVPVPLPTPQQNPFAKPASTQNPFAKPPPTAAKPAPPTTQAPNPFAKVASSSATNTATTTTPMAPAPKAATNPFAKPATPSSSASASPSSKHAAAPSSKHPAAPPKTPTQPKPPPPASSSASLKPPPSSKASTRARVASEEEPTTQPGVRPVPVAVEEAAAEKRGEIGALLAAVSPFLWSLEDAARWADVLADAGDPAARNHARALHLLAKILAQLQARIDESGA